VPRGVNGSTSALEQLIFRSKLLSKQRRVQCGTHGEVLPAYVCCHLVPCGPAPLGFHEPDPDPDEPDDLQAWCDACDEVLEQHGEWNDESEAFAKIRLVCEFCFAALRERHGQVASGA
jgi:hypothetical protein